MLNANAIFFLSKKNTGHVTVMWKQLTRRLCKKYRSVGYLRLVNDELLWFPWNAFDRPYECPVGVRVVEYSDVLACLMVHFPEEAVFQYPPLLLVARDLFRIIADYL